MLGIIIPTLNAAGQLGPALAAIGPNDGTVLVVSDGGSTDGTTEIASRAGVFLTNSPPGRGRQLATGANAAIKKGAGWLLFIHADSRLPQGWQETVNGFCASPENKNRAGYFALGFDNNSTGAARVAWLGNLRAQILGLPYGDQGLLISAAFYNELGGFDENLSLMEDVDMARRIKRARLVALDGTMRTSAEKYVRDGWWLRPLKNIFCLALYFFGASQQTIRGFYR